MTTQRSLFDQPAMPYAGRVPDAGTDTSREAAEALTESLGQWQTRVLRALTVAPMTDEALEQYLHCERTRTSRPRRRELQLMGYVTDSGKREVGDTGHRQIVWAITDAGRERLKR